MKDQTIKVPIVNRTESPRLSFDYSLEALRGLAAVFVVLEHAFANGPGPDPYYRLSGIWQYPAPGHLSVVIFFMLSGYVIGLTNSKPITTNLGRRTYLRKRFVRLYPLYLLALLVTVAVAATEHKYYTVGTFSGYLFFLQGLVVKVPAHNQPIWSLGYEIFYYLLFLVVSARQWRAEWVVMFFLILGLFLVKIQVSPIVLVSFCYGAVFWFIGLFITTLRRNTAPLQFGTMLAFLLLMLSYQRLNLLLSGLLTLHLDVNAISFPSFFDRAITFSDFSLLLFCIPLLTCFTNRTLIGQRWLELAAFTVPGAYLIAYVLSGKIWQPTLFNTAFLPSCFYLLAVLAYMLRCKLQILGESVLQWLSPIGYISYGIYIIHYPLFFIFHQITFFSGTALTFIIRLFIYLTIVVSVGWLLERRLQPWIKKKLL